MPLLSYANITWDEQQPVSQDFGDVYFSRNNGLEETRYVFIKQNQLEERFAAIETTSPVFTIGETGFGSGLNFLCTLHTFLKYAPSHAQLHFISTEKHPLHKKDLDKALSPWKELGDFKETLLIQYPPLFPGFYQLSFANHRVRLTLLWGDATTQLSTLTGSYVDAWFLDGFAPAKNPDLWNEALFKQIARLSKTNATFATFTAASQVRQLLTQIGFVVNKTSGFANKREMLFGYWPLPPQMPISKPWFQINTLSSHEKKAIIIGGGLAGATSAWSLAKRNWSVTLIDKNNDIAQESSGNTQGVLYARLSAFNNAPNKLVVQAYQYSLNLLNSFYQDVHPDAWSPCGVLQLAFNKKEQKRYQELAESCLYPADVVKAVTAEEASLIAGIEVTLQGLYFRNGGWVNPPLFCRDLINDSRIRLQLNTEVAHLYFDSNANKWSLLDANQNIVAQAPVVVIANNRQATLFEQTSQLPLKTIRGQITYLPSNAVSNQLKTVVCADRYLTPAKQHLHNLGASFNLHDDTPLIRDEDHQTNLEMLETSFSHLRAAFDPLSEPLQGRVGFRTVTPDYMPIVGPVPLETQFIEDYGALRKNANARLTKQGSYFPGLFINTAHGSRGLLTCPLSAELLAAHINGEILPLEKDVAELLHPARFVIKDLIRRIR